MITQNVGGSCGSRVLERDPPIFSRLGLPRCGPESFWFVDWMYPGRHGSTCDCCHLYGFWRFESCYLLSSLLAQTYPGCSGFGCFGLERCEIGYDGSRLGYRDWCYGFDFCCGCECWFGGQWWILMNVSCCESDCRPEFGDYENDSFSPCHSAGRSA